MRSLPEELPARTSILRRRRSLDLILILRTVIISAWENSGEHESCRWLAQAIRASSACLPPFSDQPSWTHCSVFVLMASLGFRLSAVPSRIPSTFFRESGLYSSYRREPRSLPRSFHNYAVLINHERHQSSRTTCIPPDTPRMQNPRSSATDDVIYAARPIFS